MNFATAKRQKKQQWPKVKLIAHKSGVKAWQVDARIGGKGERLYFGTKVEAEAKADGLRIERANNGTTGVAFPDSLRREALEASQRLATVGASLTVAVDYFLKHAKPIGGEKTAAEVIEEFLRVKTAAGLRPDYLSVQKYVLSNVFGGAFGSHAIHQIQYSELERWMAGREWSARTRRNYHSDLANLFNFAVRQKYCATNPLNQLDKPKVTAKPPGVLTVDQASALLAAALLGDSAMLAGIAVGLFAGLRSAEIERLDWKYIRLDLGTIEVTAEASKLSVQRIVKMRDNLKLWLVRGANSEGPVVPSSFAFRLTRCATEAKIEKWPKNAMRHSFASYDYAEHDNAAATAGRLGHFGSTRTFINSYRGLVQPAEAAKYWGLVPAVEKGNPVGVVSGPVAGDRHEITAFSICVWRRRCTSGEASYRIVRGD